MIKFKLTACLILLMPLSVLAQNIDEIIEKHLEVTGGRENWENIQSLIIEGYSNTDMIGVRYFKSFEKKSGLFKLESSPDSNLYSPDIFAFDGEIIWKKDKKGLHNMSDKPMYQKFVDNYTHIAGEFMTPRLIYYKTDHYTLTYEGIDTLPEISQVQFYILKLVNDETTISFYIYINTSSYLIQAVKTTTMTYFEDFRSVGGLVFPHVKKTDFGMTLYQQVISNMEINVSIPDQIFKYPDK